MGHSAFFRLPHLKWAGLTVLLGCALVVSGFLAGSEAAWATSSHHIRRRARVVRRHRGARPLRHRSRRRILRRHRVARRRYIVSRRSRYRRRRAVVAHRRYEAAPTETTPEPTLAEIPSRRFLALPPLYGSRASLLRQNRRADEENLARIENRQQLAELVNEKFLVPLPVSRGLTVDPSLDPHRRYCRPWTASFLRNFSAAHYARFHSPIRVDSAVRTVAFQERLLRINGNAAPASGDNASPHLTGEAVDIGKKGLSRLQIGWMRAYLSRLESQRKIDVEEEFYQACFHISVYESYMGRKNLPPPYYASTEPEKQRRHTSSLLATGLQ